MDANSEITSIHSNNTDIVSDKTGNTHEPNNAVSTDIQAHKG